MKPDFELYRRMQPCLVMTQSTERSTPRWGQRYHLQLAPRVLVSTREYMSLERPSTIT